MFKDMFAFLGADYDEPRTDFEKKFFDNIEKFAFYDELNAACVKNEGKDIAALVAAGNYKAVVAICSSLGALTTDSCLRACCSSTDMKTACALLSRSILLREHYMRQAQARLTFTSP